MLVVYHSGDNEIISAITDHIPEKREKIDIPNEDGGEDLFRVREILRKLIKLESGVVLEMFFIELRDIDED